MGDSKCKYYQCECQRFSGKNDEKNECFCAHSKGFHEIPFSKINKKEHPFGKCSICSCQFYKEGTSIECFYCGHFQCFHLSWENSADMVGNSSNNNAGRPEADTIKLIILCFDLLSPNKLPKYLSSSWDNLKKKGLIKECVISKNENISEKVSKLFNLDQGWTLYDPKFGKPSKVEEKLCSAEKRELNEDEKGLDFKLIKKYMTRKNRRLYIGPDTHDIDDNDSTNNNIDADITTNEDVSNQPSCGPADGSSHINTYPSTYFDNSTISHEFNDFNNFAGTSGHTNGLPVNGFNGLSDSTYISLNYHNASAPPGGGANGVLNYQQNRGHASEIYINSLTIDIDGVKYLSIPIYLEHLEHFKGYDKTLTINGVLYVLFDISDTYTNGDIGLADICQSGNNISSANDNIIDGLSSNTFECTHDNNMDHSNGGNNGAQDLDTNFMLYGDKQ
ncbi:hypothetical protein RclHR1_03740011 [Rhizophagus clarus]|uniref:Uncharacterized protein n=1 Tax=Rhizophagus clarus TaxID=94130 RepID=A0A2Z6S728_9GLOM|nr:hypothetical protein RclHR1_03740011 [Rhizophagus clarus]GES82857.1 hypothetical protein GLOIN_2v1477364 [Rhizophagus clarus]